jgi:hypothetical protein
MYPRSLVLSIVLLSTVASGQSVVGANAPDAYQVKVLTKTGSGDSYIDITNSGQSGRPNLFAGTTAATGGAICANVYVFAADEQLMECRSCAVTPNESVELSVQRDMIPNVIEPQLPINGITLALVATIPVANSCNGSAYQSGGFGVGLFPEDGTLEARPGISPVLAPGMAAWGSTVHVNTSSTPPTYQVTETPFERKPLQDNEANRMAFLCSFMQANGGGAGICHGCTVGALGAAKQ